jgi:hypothetical protein
MKNMGMAYSYDRSAAAKPKKPAAGETTRTKKPEVEKAIKALQAAIEAVHDCAPSGRDYQEDGGFDSKAYGKAVIEHGKRIDSLHSIISDLNKQREIAE